jgi:PKD repeat protein
MLLVLLVVGMLSTVAGSASAAGWLAPQNVPLSVSDLGFDEHGNAIAVGVGADGGGASSFRSMVRPLGGQWSVTSLPVSGIGDSDVRGPQVAVDPQGNAVAVWSADNQDAATHVLRASARPAGGAWSDPVVISNTDNAVNARDHDVAIDAQGNATAIWSELTNDGFVVRSANRPSGGVWSDPVELSEGALSSQPRLAVDPQGTVTAVWLGTTPDDDGPPGVVTVVRSNRRPAGGAWGSTVALSSVGGAISADGGPPQVAVDAQGTATAVWGSFSSGGGYVVQTARRVAGSTWGPAGDLGAGQSPQVAVDPQGNATAVWEVSPNQPSSVVLSSSRTGAGPWSSPAPMAAGNAVDKVGYPWVAADPQGNVTAIWARYNDTKLLAQATRHVAGSSSWSPTVDLTVGRPITAIPAAGVDPQGHVSMVWSSTEDPWSGSSSVFDPIAPELRDVATPANVHVAGQPVGMSVNPFDVWSTVAVSWDFGDGGSASGAAVSHTYASAGDYTVTITGVDSVGNTTKTTQRIAISAAPGPKPPESKPDPKPRPAPKAPLLSGLKQSNARWLTHKVKRGPRLPVGTTFRFKLDRAAQVRFSFSQLVTGRRVGGRCVKATKANRRKPRCDRAQAAGTLRVTGKAGNNVVAFSGKISGRALKPGRYRLVVTAVADGKTSSAKSIQFTIAR